MIGSISWLLPDAYESAVTVKSCASPDVVNVYGLSVSLSATASASSVQTSLPVVNDCVAVPFIPAPWALVTPSVVSSVTSSSPSTTSVYVASASSISS